MREAFDGTPAFVGGKRGKPCLHISILRDIARIFSAFLMTRKQLLQCYCLGDFKRNLIPFLFFVLGMALPVPSKKRNHVHNGSEDQAEIVPFSSTYRPVTYIFHQNEKVNISEYFTNAWAV